MVRGPLLLSLLLAAPAAAQPGEPQCPAAAEPLPAALAGWTAAPAPLDTAASVRGAPAVALGKTYQLHLMPTRGISYPAPTGKADGPDFGGIATVAIPAAGTYRVALGEAAWVDLVQGATPIESTTHGHGPACSGIHKFVDFSLQSGNYVLSIAGNLTDKVSVLIVRLP